MPIGLGYIAAMLELNGFSTRIVDADALLLSRKELITRLKQFQPDIVGITSMSNNFPNAIKTAKIVKEWNREAVVVMGGVHPTFMHKEIMLSVPEVDIIARYEGELTLTEIAENIENKHSLEKIKGITFREDKNKITSTPFRQKNMELDKLPYPNFNVLEPSVESYIGKYGIRNYPIITTRGCPFGCIFCSTMAFHGRQYRTREIRRVVDEIEYIINKHRINDVSIVDDNFTLNNKRVVQFCEEMKKRQITVDWGCNARVDQVSTELLQEMHKAGCKEIFFGIESAFQPVLDVIRKGFTVKQAKAAVIAAERVGIRTHCSFIIGLPGETAQSLTKIVAFIKETKPTGRVLPNVLEILPGTELFVRSKEYFGSKASIPNADIVKTQVEIMTSFYRNNFDKNELFRVMPPNIAIE